MLYAPPRNISKWNWIGRIAERCRLNPRQRQIAELNYLGLSDHMRQDLGLVDARFLRSLF